MTIQEVQEEIIEEFSLFDNKNDQYTYIIELGKNLADIDDAFRSDDHIVKGCQSKVWLQTGLEDDAIVYNADSDSTLVKGLVSLLVRVLSGRHPKEILEAELFFIEKIGLKGMLSMNRSNGLMAMIKQMKLYALAYQTKLTNA